MIHKIKRHLRLGLFVQPIGQHVSGWRLTQRLGSPTDIDWLITLAKKTEQGKFDLYFVGDALATGMYRRPSTMARLEPLTMLSALAVNTSHIGLAATASTTFTDPFSLARSFSSLDHISRGNIRISAGLLPCAKTANCCYRARSTACGHHAWSYADCWPYSGSSTSVMETA